MILLLLAQAAPVTSAPVNRVSATPPSSFSVLYDACPKSVPGKDVVVCGADPATSQRLPLPDDAPPTPNYVKPDSGDYRDNKMGGAPCSADMRGCTVGFGPPLVQWAIAGVNALKAGAKTRREARARAADGDRRQPIDLTAPAPAGRLQP